MPPGNLSAFFSVCVLVCAHLCGRVQAHVPWVQAWGSALVCVAEALRTRAHTYYPGACTLACSARGRACIKLGVSGKLSVRERGKVLHLLFSVRGFKDSIFRCADW